MSSDLILTASLAPAMVIALIAGVISFISPCVLPIVPPYLAFMSGVSLQEMDTKASARRRALLAALFFVLGLSTVFLLLGLGASALGRALLAWRDVMNMAAGLLIMLFGLHFLGIFRIGFLDREARLDMGDQGGSAFGAYLLGLAFAFGWTPCLGPVLGAILGLAASSASLAKGAILLLCYAVGLGLPFLLVAAFFPRLDGTMRWLKRNLERVERISGLLLWTIGLMMLTGQFTRFSFWIVENIPWLATIG